MHVYECGVCMHACVWMWSVPACMCMNVECACMHVYECGVCMHACVWMWSVHACIYSHTIHACVCKYICSCSSMWSVHACIYIVIQYNKPFVHSISCMCVCVLACMVGPCSIIIMCVLYINFSAWLAQYVLYIKCMAGPVYCRVYTYACVCVDTTGMWFLKPCLPLQWSNVAIIIFPCVHACMHAHSITRRLLCSLTSEAMETVTRDVLTSSASSTCNSAIQCM